jgi:hypothetical protein
MNAQINGRIGAGGIGADVDQILVLAVGRQRLARARRQLLLFGVVKSRVSRLTLSSTSIAG